MNYKIHPKRILSRKLDSLISNISFSLQNLGIRIFNSKMLFFLIKKSHYAYIQTDLILDDETFSKYFYKNMMLSLDFCKLSYFIKGERNKFPSVCNLQYFGKELLLCKNLYFNNLKNKIICNKEYARKIRSRELSLNFKNLLGYTSNLIISSTILEFQKWNFKGFLNNEEFENSKFLINNLHLIYFTGITNGVTSNTRKFRFFSIFLFECENKNITGIHKKNKKFWFRRSVKNKHINSKNGVISQKIKKIFSPRKIYFMNLICSSNWRDKKNSLYISRLKNIIEWVYREIVSGLKENDLNFRNPVSLDNSLFILRKSFNLSPKNFNISSDLKFETLESQFFNFSIELQKGIIPWKTNTICFENCFNKLFYRIINSTFCSNEINFTHGIECSRQNHLLFNSFSNQKISSSSLFMSNELKTLESHVNRFFDFKTYTFSLGRSLNYSKF